MKSEVRSQKSVVSRKKTSDSSLSPQPSSLPSAPLVSLRPYQKPVFMDRETGVQVLHWSRQIGKSYTLAAWAVDRLLSRPGRLVTILSNSRDNGAELNMKVAEVCQKLGQAFEQDDKSIDLRYENMNMETRISVNGRIGRIKVLAANPRTARGFSGDLILDEFAFHENSQKIWEAAEPILSSNPDFLCRIASTGNGRYNMFYQMATCGQFPVSRVTRTDAWKLGVKIYHPVNRKPITPDEARAMAMDKAAYDQNYECIFADENAALLTWDLINAAEDGGCGVVCDQTWSPEAITRLSACEGNIFLGIDVGRKHDLTEMAALEQVGREYFLRALLRCRDMRLPDQQERIGLVCRMPKFRRAAIDMTGIGLGLVEYSQDAFGAGRIVGINFSSTVPVTKVIAQDGRKAQTVRVTEAMATELLQVYEDHRMHQPLDPLLREELHKPEKITSPGGRVSIAATRDEAGHADGFWAVALGIEASATVGGPFAAQSVSPPASRGGAGRIRSRKALPV